MLLIRIFDQVQNPFGIENVVEGDYIKERDDKGNLTGKVSLIDGTFKGINRLQTKMKLSIWKETPMIRKIIKSKCKIYLVAYPTTNK